MKADAWRRVKDVCADAFILNVRGLATTNKSSGFTLLFEPVVYGFSDAIELVRGMSLLGSGGSFYSNGTVFQFPEGKEAPCPPNATLPGAVRRGAGRDRPVGSA